jgi:hypothetical protein
MPEGNKSRVSGDGLGLSAQYPSFCPITTAAKFGTYTEWAQW